jgi:hypothetical protein
LRPEGAGNRRESSKKEPGRGKSEHLQARAIADLADLGISGNGRSQMSEFFSAPSLLALSSSGFFHVFEGFAILGLMEDKKSFQMK